MTSEQRLIEFFARPKESKTKVLDRAIAEILDDDISAATKATLLKQIEQPLPDVKAGNEIQDATIEAPNMRGQGQPGARMNRQARLLEPSGNPEVFKVVSLVFRDARVSTAVGRENPTTTYERRVKKRASFFLKRVAASHPRSHKVRKSAC